MASSVQGTVPVQGVPEASPFGERGMSPQGCPAPKNPEEQEQEKQRWTRLERRRAYIVIFTTLLVCPLPTVVLLPVWTRAPGVFSALALGWLLWVLALLALFRAVVHGVARYQQEVFDLRARGVPLWRSQQQVEQEAGDIFDQVVAQEDEEDGQKSQKGKPDLGVSPVRLSATFLWESLYPPLQPQPNPRRRTSSSQQGRNAGERPVQPRRVGLGGILRALLWLPWRLALMGLVTPVSHVLFLSRPMPLTSLLEFWQRPEGQMALWLGGVRWWLLGPNVVVILEDLFLGRYRVLVGPSLSPRTQERVSTRRRGSLEQWVPLVLSPSFYSEGFERVRKLWFTEVYTVTLKTVHTRTRDGIPVQLTNVQARMRLQSGSPSAPLEHLICRLFLRKAGHDQPWSQEWLLSIQGYLELRQWFISLLEQGLRQFVARHSLSQLLTILQPEAAELVIWELVIQKGLALYERSRAPFPIELRNFLEEFLRKEGVVLEDFHLPTWRLPDEIQKRHRQVMVQLRQLSQSFQEMKRAERQFRLRYILEDWQVLTKMTPPMGKLDEAVFGEFLEHMRSATMQLLTRWERDLRLVGEYRDNLHPQRLKKYEEDLSLLRSLRRFLQTHPQQWMVE